MTIRTTLTDKPIFDHFEKHPNAHIHMYYQAFCVQVPNIIQNRAVKIYRLTLARADNDNRFNAIGPAHLSNIFTYTSCCKFVYWYGNLMKEVHNKHWYPLYKNDSSNPPTEIEE